MLCNRRESFPIVEGQLQVALFGGIVRSQLFVLDQDQAIDFYVNKLGLEIAEDRDYGFVRRVVLNVAGQPERQVRLETPGPPIMDESNALKVRDLLRSGNAGGRLSLTTPDAHACYHELQSLGVEAHGEPAVVPEGIEFRIRDPFGNTIHIAQPHGDTGVAA
jgi:catechol 2,3-dioxygenase-like lactoylglutathione lyase family enzyme